MWCGSVSIFIETANSELLKHLHNVLKTSDLDTATAATVRRRLEEQLDIDLSDKKTYIRKQIDLYLQSHYNDNNPEPEKEGEEGEEKDLGNVKEEEESDGSVSAKDDESEKGESEEESEEESDDEDVKSNGKRNKTTPNGKKRGGGGFSKPCALSPQLQKLIGEPEMARTEVVKKIWVYIKEKDLQNPKDKRKILCDDTLHEIFRVKSINMFQMNKALTKHIWPLDEEYETAATVKPPQKSKPKKRVKEEEPMEKDKRQKTKGSGFTSPHPISEELMQFFDTDESELSRSEVVKRMWKYIKDNDLQDPSDKRNILCDDKLKELFKVDKFVGFTVSKLLSAHFIKE
ncbi:DEK, C-terminal [Artemisia annua]|uniref:DEK, C-terminal n=1 Tax=Artemisia annua TaxID=35608 RepID=A0A2U1NT61_ARTAN|nr:DEK, C-terminal [Artemisia annua]